MLEVVVDFFAVFEVLSTFELLSIFKLFSIFDFLAIFKLLAISLIPIEPPYRSKRSFVEKNSLRNNTLVSVANGHPRPHELELGPFGRLFPFRRFVGVD